jgi:3-carboxy-cis,cis-muconate cycloisomerase
VLRSEIQTVHATSTTQSPFSLLTKLAGDRKQLEIFSERGSIEGWLATERALALAQAEYGVVQQSDALAIAEAARFENIDLSALWKSASNVGYPILGLVREIGRSLEARVAGRVHFGVTTQDIMDTGLALQVARSLVALDTSLQRVGDALADRVGEHAETVMPARTHGQQAVPTTFGTTLATLLGQFTRQRQRLAEATPRIAVVSLFGAGGTAAALGPTSRRVRASVAQRLDLGNTDIPWHVDRDGPAEFGWLCATIAATCAKFARNIVDLSRTEIGEVFEPYESHRGASSTMPQKVNPISSEIIIGLSGTAGALTSSLTRLQEAGHERAAGEWQIEWHVLPQLAVLVGSALEEAARIIEGMRVATERMRANLLQDGGLIMAEAQMMQFAQTIGHDRAHDLVYEAATRARREGLQLADALAEVARSTDARLPPARFLTAGDYLGEAMEISNTAVEQWKAVGGLPARSPINELACH